MNRYLNLAFLIVILAPALFITGCASNAGTGSAGAQDMKMAPLSSLPQEMQIAPATVREAYQFAVANPDALKNVPCYCGCGKVGHTSNFACYVKQVNSDGTIVYDNHALGCSLCVDIARDVRQMSQNGKSPGEIHNQILATYSSFGPPNQ